MIKTIDAVNFLKAEWTGSHKDAAFLRGAKGVVVCNSNYRLATRICTHDEFIKCVDKCTGNKFRTVHTKGNEMEQIKPEVIGYKCIEYGRPANRFVGSSNLFTKEDAIAEARDDNRAFEMKSKFRPVYKKENDHV